MSAMGLRDPLVAITAATVLLICSSVGPDMQQDRSTGWRLGTTPVQFWYQILGIGMGAVLCVVLARMFMSAYPVLALNSFDHPEAKVGQWQSAMTYKLVGAIRGLGNLPLHQLVALEVGFALGLVIEVLRKVLRASPSYSGLRRAAQAQVLPSAGWRTRCSSRAPTPTPSGRSSSCPPRCGGAPGASSPRRGTPSRGARGPRTVRRRTSFPADMTTTSLVGGGLIAGESLFYLALALIGLGALV